MTQPPPPPGWYPSPYQDDTQTMRYWDGQRWNDPPPPSSRPAAANSSSDPARGPAFGVIAGAAVIVIGTFMPWIDIQGGFVSIDKSGVAYSSDVPWIIGLAVLAALGAVADITGTRVLPAFIKVGAILDGILIAVLVGADASEIQRRIADAQQASSLITGQIGAGVWVNLVGALLVIVCGYNLRKSRGGSPLPDLWSGESIFKRGRSQPSDRGPNLPSS